MHYHQVSTLDSVKCISFWPLTTSQSRLSSDEARVSIYPPDYSQSASEVRYPTFVVVGAPP